MYLAAIRKNATEIALRLTEPGLSQLPDEITSLHPDTQNRKKNKNKNQVWAVDLGY